MSVHSAPALPATEPPLLNRTFVLATSSMHLYFIAFFSTYTALPLFLEDAPEWQVGLVVGIFGVPPWVMRFLAGRLADRYGRRGTMITGAAITTVCFALYGLSTSLWLLIPLRLLNGGVMSLYATANTALIADVAPSARRGEAMGYFNFVNTGAQIYAPLAALLAAEHLGFEWYWGAVTLAMVGCTALAIATPETHVEARRPGPLISRGAVLPFLVFVCATTGWSTLLAFLTPYADDLSLDAGIWFFVVGVAMLLVRINSGRLADRFGRARVIIPGIVAMCAGLVLLGATEVPALFFAAALLIGAGLGAAHTSLSALTIDRAEANGRAAAIALFLLGWDVGQVLGTIPLGVVAGAAGYGPTFILGGAITLLGIPILLRGLSAGPGSSHSPPAAG